MSKKRVERRGDEGGKRREEKENGRKYARVKKEREERRGKE